MNHDLYSCMFETMLSTLFCVMNNLQYIHTKQWWSEYNVCICIQGHLSCVFEPKLSLTSKCLTYSNSALEEEVDVR